MCSNNHIAQCNEVAMFQIFNYWFEYKNEIDANESAFSSLIKIYYANYTPSAIPHGYRRPRTFRPSISTTVLAPTIANGTRLLSCLNTLASSSSSNGSGKS